MQIRCLFACLALFSVFVTGLEAQIVEWRTFTNIGAIRDLEIGENMVWAASSGGVLGVSTIDGNTTKLTNTEGLSSNDVIAVEIDATGSVWFALASGILNRYSPDENTWEVVQDYSGEEISELVAYGDSLYVALGIGVSLYDLNNREVKETYTNFGFSSGSFEKIAANSLYLQDKNIWVSTDRGIAKSSITLPNLQAPSSWQKYTTANGLPSNNINSIIVLAGVVYAATNSGVARQIDDTWQISGLDGTVVQRLEVAGANDFFSSPTALAVTNSGVFWLDSTGNWQRLGAGFNDIGGLATNANGDVWIGRNNQGLAHFEFSAEEWQLTSTNSPGSNDFKSLLLDSKGRLWCASQTNGIHLYDNGVWTNFTRATGLPSFDYRTILEDSEGRIWAGSWGGGVTILREEADNSYSITKIDTVGGVLAGFIDDPGFVLVNAMTRDQFDNIWILNREAVNSRVLAVRDAGDDFHYFSTNNGLRTIFVNSIEADRSGRIWIGTDNQGIQVVDYNQTLNNPNDDDLTQGLTTNDNLFSNEIHAVVEDEDGVIWIGTNEGLHFWSGGLVGYQPGVVSNSVTTIGVDGRNNKWIGTTNGITVLKPDREKVGDFTTANSPLVSSNIQSFAFNATTGETWIGTDNGLSRALTLFTAPKPDLAELTGYPNPFIIDGTGREFRITNLALNTDINIYTPSGVLVKTLRNIDSAEAPWDGTDDDNKPVASGVYVYLAFTDAGLAASGKVALIRR